MSFKSNASRTILITLLLVLSITIGYLSVIPGDDTAGSIEMKVQMKADNNVENIMGTRANDDDPGNATLVNLGDTKTDTLDNITDASDWYKINLNAGDILILNLTVPVSGDFDLYFYSDPYDWPIGYSYDEKMGGYEEITYNALQAGLYYIEVNAWTASGQYTLKIIQGTPPDNDNDAESGTVIVPGTPETSDLDKDNLDSNDWWKLLLQEGDAIGVRLDVPATGDFDLYVMDPHQTIIASSSGEENIEECTFGASLTGTYYILVHAYDGSGEYTLTVTELGTYVPDHNDDMGNATVLPVPYAMLGELNTTVDMLDWYRITLDDGVDVTIWLDVPDNADFQLTLRTADDFIEVKAKPGKGVDEKIVFEAGPVRSRASSDYYLAVWANTSVPCPDSPYTLIIDQTDNVVESDSDNSFGDATELDPPDTIEDSLNYPWDVRDHFSIEAGAEREEIISIDLDIPDDSSVELLVYDEDERWAAAANISEEGHMEYVCPEEGTYYIVVYMYSGTGDYTMDVDVLSSNLPPEIVSLLPASDDVTANEGDSVRFEIEISDEDVPDLTYEWRVDNNRIDDVEGDVFEVNTTHNAEYSAGLYEITVEVTDPGDLTVSSTWNLTVVDVNLKPEITIEEPAESEMTINETESISFEIEATDADGTTPAIVWKLNDEVIEDEDTDKYLFETDHNSEGTYTILVEVLDVADDSLVNSTSWSITVLNTDREPVLSNQTPSGKAKTDEASPAEFSLDALDPDGDAVSYEWFVDGELIKSADEKSFEYEPDFDSAGEHEIRVAVTSGSFTINHTWKVTVENVNRRPVINSNSLMPLPDADLSDEEPIEFIILAMDPDGDTVDYIWKIIETGQTFKDQTFVHTLKGGIYTINITASDENGGVDHFEFAIEVKETPSGDAPGFGLTLLLLSLLASVGIIRHFGRRE